MLERDRKTRLWVEGVDPETKEKLKRIAADKYGRANVSRLLKELVEDYANGSDRRSQNPAGVDMASDVERVEVRLPADALRQVEERAEQRLCSRNYYLTSLVYADLAAPQLLGDEIEILRRSNYELAKIGTNLNQVARAFNLLLKARGHDKMPELGKKIASLRSDIKAHTNMVLGVLKTKTVVWDRDLKGAKARRKKGL